MLWKPKIFEFGYSSRANNWTWVSRFSGLLEIGPNSDTCAQTRAFESERKHDYLPSRNTSTQSSAETRGLESEPKLDDSSSSQNARTRIRAKARTKTRGLELESKLENSSQSQNSSARAWDKTLVLEPESKFEYSSFRLVFNRASKKNT